MELGRPRSPEPMSLVMTHSLDEDGMARSLSPKQSVIDELFQRLTIPLPSRSSNPKLPRSNHLLNNPKHLRWPHHTLTHSPKCLTTGKNPSRANGLLSVRNGPLSANISRPQTKSGNPK